MSSSTGLLMKYFVLKPKGTDEYANASRAAMIAYSERIKEANPELSKQLQFWAVDEAYKAQGNDGQQ